MLASLFKGHNVIYVHKHSTFIIKVKRFTLLARYFEQVFKLMTVSQTQIRSGSRLNTLCYCLIWTFTVHFKHSLACDELRVTHLVFAVQTVVCWTLWLYRAWMSQGLRPQWVWTSSWPAVTFPRICWGAGLASLSGHSIFIHQNIGFL